MAAQTLCDLIRPEGIILVCYTKAAYYAAETTRRRKTLIGCFTWSVLATNLYACHVVYIEWCHSGL